MLYGISNIHSKCDHRCYYSHANKVVEDDAFRDGVMLAEIVDGQGRRIKVARHGEAVARIKQKSGVRGQKRPNA
jgi:hypothetical protein